MNLETVSEACIGHGPDAKSNFPDSRRPCRCYGGGRAGRGAMRLTARSLIGASRALVHGDGEAGGGVRRSGGQATRTEIGLATRSMRLSTSTAMAASPCWAGKLRPRSFGPMIAL